MSKVNYDAKRAEFFHTIHVQKKRAEAAARVAAVQAIRAEQDRLINEQAAFEEQALCA